MRCSMVEAMCFPVARFSVISASSSRMEKAEGRSEILRDGCERTVLTWFIICLMSGEGLLI